MSLWYENAVFYSIYPIGFCGAEKFNDGGEVKYRLDKIIDWIPHLKKMEINAIYLGPVFESVEHGYDTTDYMKIDRRLGDNKSFKNICQKLHENGIRIVVDGVFNHVGRNFWAFKDIQEKGRDSKYCSWFQNLNFDGQSPCGDNFWYEGWNGHYNLVKLNMRNPETADHIINAVEMWIDEFDIDGIRLDAADCIDFDFFKRLRYFCKSKKSDFWLMGEIIHGDYNRWANPEMLDSTTNYECYKGIYSSHNDKNYFEIDYSINRQFGNNGIYKNIKLFTFVDNHDVNRLASTLKNPEHLCNCYTLMYTMPGIPSIYYGSEFGITGIHEHNSDDALRPCIDLEKINKTGNIKLLNHIIKLGRIYKAYPALRTGSYQTIIIRNQQLLFKKELNGQIVYVALNLEDKDYDLNFCTNLPALVDVFSSQSLDVSNGNAYIKMPPYSSMIIVTDDIINSVDADNVETEIITEILDEVLVNRKYMDLKGNIYMVIAIARDTETLEELVIYKALHGSSEVWATPKSIFMKNIDGSQRFKLID